MDHVRDQLSWDEVYPFLICNAVVKLSQFLRRHCLNEQKGVSHVNRRTCMSSDSFFALKYEPNLPRRKRSGSAQALLDRAFKTHFFQDLFLHCSSELP